MGSFKDVVGHRDVIQYLQNAIAENRVSHTFPHLDTTET